MSDERLRLTAEMRDRLTPGLRRLQTVMAATARSAAFQKLAVDMGRLERAGYRLGFVMGRTIRYSAIAAAGGAAIAGAAFVKFGKDAADALDENAALAKQIGISADSLRTLQGVATRYNVTQEGLSAGLTKFNVNFGRLKQNQGAFYTYLSKTNPALASQFKRVGSTGDAFLLLSDAISKTADPAKRAALVKAAGLPQEFLRFFADGPDDLRETIKQVIRFQGILGPKASDDAARYGDNLDNIGLAWKGLNEKLAATALPIVNPMLADLANFMADNRERISAGFAQVIGDIATALKGFASWIASPAGGEALKSFWSDLKDIASALAAVAKAVNDVVHSMGGWKVVLGGIAALKAAGMVKKLVTDAVPGGGGGWLETALGFLAGKKAKGGTPSTPGSGGSPAGLPLGGPLTQFFLYQLGKAGITAALDALPKPTMPEGYDPKTFDPWTDLKEQVGKFFADHATKDGTRTEIDPGLAERARRSADAFRADPEGTRGRMRVQLGRRADVEAAAKTLAEVDATIKQLREHGADKSMSKEFADLVAQRNAIAARIEQERAADIGRKIGTEAGNSFFDRLKLLLQGISYQGSGNTGGGRVWNASYQPAGRAQAATRAAFTAGSGGKGMLDLIASAEGTGNDYNTTLGYGRLTGGPVNLTGMTLDQVDALQTRMLKHPANKWNSSAVGRYQFVRTRLRELRKRYGLSGSTLFTPDLQDALGRLSLSERGGSVRGLRNEWQGLNKVPATVLRDAIHNRERRRAARPAGEIKGSASVDIRFPNGVPAGTKVGAQGKGLFREVNLDTGRTMKEAMA